MKIKYDLLCTKYFNEAIETLKKAITFDTTKQKAEKNKPFGKGNYDCLMWIMNLAKSWGFEPVFDDQNYYGYFDYGQANDIFIIAAHLDVVPTGDLKKWMHPAFEPIIKDNKLYGRGALDDKGPLIANLYALKYLKDHNYQPKNFKIRLFFGCNEEGTMECVEKYVKKEQLPKLGYTPDGFFPCIYCEKWIVNIDIFGKTNNLFTLKGGQQYNIVNDVVYYSGPKMQELAKLLEKNNLKCVFENNKLKVSGTAAHGSLPELGVNAGTWILYCLKQLHIEHPLVNLIADNFHLDFAGTKIFGNITDESGSLSANLGITNLDENGNVKIGINFRVPISFNPKNDILKKINELVKKNLIYQQNFLVFKIKYFDQKIVI